MVIINCHCFIYYIIYSSISSMVSKERWIEAVLMMVVVTLIGQGHAYRDTPLSGKFNIYVTYQSSNPQ